LTPIASASFLENGTNTRLCGTFELQWEGSAPVEAEGLSCMWTPRATQLGGTRDAVVGALGEH